jgi:hypothetical protein
MSPARIVGKKNWRNIRVALRRFRLYVRYRADAGGTSVKHCRSRDLWSDAFGSRSRCARRRDTRRTFPQSFRVGNIDMSSATVDNAGLLKRVRNDRDRIAPRADHLREMAQLLGR